MRLARLFSLFVVLLLVSCFSAQAEGPVDGPQTSPGQPQAKVDPILRMLLARNERSLQETGHQLNLTLFADLVGVYADGRPILEGPRVAGTQVVEQVRADRVGVLVTIEGSPEKLKQTGAQVGTVAGNIVTARVTLGQLERIAALPEVTYVAASHRLQLLATETPGSSEASLRHPNLDVSMPETGADDRHAAGNEGAGVVVGVVDTGLDQTHGDFSGRIVCYSDQTGNPLDTDGHGTHVTGIAVGDGSSSAAGYVGMAPEADICAVKTDMTEAGIIDGVDWIFTQAGLQPAVVNLSLGGHGGPHDGTSSFVQGLESLLGPGKIIVAAAGNEGDMAIHAGGDVPAGGSIDITFDFPPPGSPGPGITWPEYGSDIFDYWYDGAANVCLTVISPNGYSVGPVCTGNSTGIITLDGCVVVDNASTGPAPNGDNELLSYVDGTYWGCPYDMAAGNWTYRFGAAGGARIDGWAVMLIQEFNPPYGNTAMTVGMPAVGNEIIAVASHVTKDCWQSIDGNTYCDSDPAVVEGDISPYSSKGPTRDGRTKPDISAPGTWIASALSGDSSWPAELITPDGVHLMLLGTSMSSPHVTGAVALLLEEDPSLTAAGIKTWLQNYALQDGYTGSTPNNTWGAGKLRLPLVCYTLTKNVSPGGSGSIASSPSSSGGCPAGQYSPDTVVNLTANPAADYEWSSWSGTDNDGINPTTVTMNSSRSVTAYFTPVCYTLTKNVSPGGSGSIASSPSSSGGCPAGQYSPGTVVDLTANPAADYEWSSWSGTNNDGVNPTTVTMNSSRSVTAYFTPVCYTLSKNVSPPGTGSIASSPSSSGGCPAGQYSPGTVVDLTANPAADYQWSSWSGTDNNGVNPTTVTMNSSRSVTAYFTPICYTLTKNVSPPGTGSIASSPSSSGGCPVGQYSPGTVVNLTANPAADYEWSSWSGTDNNGVNPTTVTMNGDRSVTAYICLDGDDDCDGFTTATEEHVGTDPYDACSETSVPNDEDPDAWPLDMDDNQRVDIYDVLKYVGVIGVMPPVYVQRLDLDANGAIDIYDVLKFVGIIAVPGKDTCTNP